MRKYLLFFAFLIVGFISSRAVDPSGTLPVIYVNIENGQEVVTKEPYLNAVYWLDPKGVPGIEPFGSQDNPLVTKIKGRGNYTFAGFDKKPYRLKLDKKAALCGMKASKHFGLLAHADDNRGFLRNALGFKASEIVGLPWTPAQYPVELVVNGTYRGIYFLTELIRIDSDRVDITKWQEEDANGNPLSQWIEGGTLVEIDNYEGPGQIQFDNYGAPEPLRFTYDKSVDPGYEPDGYVAWLKQNLGQVNDLILNGDRNSDELWNYVDIDDLARYIVVQEFTDNYESFHGSCYLYRDEGDNEKWHFSPVWDFGSAFQRSHPNHPFYEQNDGNMHYNHWIGELLEFPALRDKISQYWAVLKSHRSELDSYASAYISQISSAAAADKQRWPQYGNSDLQGKLNEVMGYLNSSTSYLNSAYASGEEADKEFYLVGDFNGWSLSDSNYKMSYIDGNYIFECYNGISGKWKINDGSWALDFGASDKALAVNEVYELVSKGHDFTTPIPAGSRIVFTYNPQGISTINIITDQPMPDYRKTVRFIDAHSSPWEQVYVWIWNNDNASENFTGGVWPGAAMTLEENIADWAQYSQSVKTWSYSFDPGREIPNLMMVFSNGQDGDENKIGDLPYSDSYTRTDMSSVGSDIAAVKGYTISASDGAITVKSDIYFNLKIANLQGCGHTYHIAPGITIISVTPGIYIVDNSKVKL